MKALLKFFIPNFILSWYHKALALFADYYYGHPSKEMIIIGITGTTGKSTVCNLIWQILTRAGYKVGMISTANLKFGDQETVNPYKMTLPGRFEAQRLLRKMRALGCQYAIVETTSQALIQWRHVGINYDVVLFNNFSPEHIEAHGGIAQYKQAKQMLFQFLMTKPHKAFSGKTIPKINIVNADDPVAQDFAKFSADGKYSFSLTNISELELARTGLSFNYQGTHFSVPMFGKFNVANILAAVTAAQSLGISIEQSSRYLYNLPPVPGRMELIKAGQDFTVIVDYAHEPKSLKALYETLPLFKGNSMNKIICVTGAAGGGRDKGKRWEMGKLAAEYCDYVILANEDPYDEKPIAILTQLAEGALKGGKNLAQDLFKYLDRREGIKKAFALAQPGDVVALLGKGSEQAICVAHGQKITWDERQVALELLSSYQK